MAIIPGNFFAVDSVADSLVPAGVYTVAIVDSEVKDTKSGDGKYLKLSFDILGGDYAGRRIWSNLNLVNKNEKAVAIAQKEFAAICRACGYDATPEDSQELHGIPMLATVKIQAGSGGFSDSNSLSHFKKLD